MESIYGAQLLRNLEGDNYCFLTEKDAVWTEPLSDILKDNGIRFITRNTLGAGIAVRVGPILERTIFYVLQDQLSQAQEILSAFFCEHTSPDM